MCIFAEGHYRDHGDTIDDGSITWRVRASTTHAERLPPPKKRKIIGDAEDNETLENLLGDVLPPLAAAAPPPPVTRPTATLPSASRGNSKKRGKRKVTFSDTVEDTVEDDAD